MDSYDKEKQICLEADLRFRASNPKIVLAEQRAKKAAEKEKLEALANLEPGIMDIDRDLALVSIAISLKNINHMLEDYFRNLRENV